jgi:hypothetical protein
MDHWSIEQSLRKGKRLQSKNLPKRHGIEIHRTFLRSVSIAPKLVKGVLSLEFFYSVLAFVQEFSLA